MENTSVPENSQKSLSNLQITFITALRIAIGWHLLYEGVAKLLTPDWTGAGFLSASRWWFSGVFNWSAVQPDLMKIVDLLNIWGLILIGLGLILGVLVKFTSIWGMVLLGLYYLAHPPFVGMDSGIPLEGHYLIVNKTLVEIFALGVIAFFPAGSVFRLDHYLSGWMNRSKRFKFRESKESEIASPAAMSHKFLYRR